MTTQADFKELGRIRTTDASELVFSEVHRDGKLVGFSLNRYVTSEAFTGFTKGIFIPEDLFIEFLKIFPKEDRKLSLEV